MKVLTASSRVCIRGIKGVYEEKIAVSTTFKKKRRTVSKKVYRYTTETIRAIKLVRSNLDAIPLDLFFMASDHAFLSHERV